MTPSTMTGSRFPAKPASVEAPDESPSASAWTACAAKSPSDGSDSARMLMAYWPTRAKLSMGFSPMSQSWRKPWTLDSHSSMAAPTPSGSTSFTPSTADWNMPASDSARVGPSVATMDGSCEASVDTMTPMRVTMFEAAVTTESARLPVSPAMSAESSPRPVSQLSHAAFMELTEPSMVVAASRAVVPPTCMLSCMTWIAATMFEKLSELESTVTPSFCWTSVILDASEMSLFISDCVPP